MAETRKIPRPEPAKNRDLVHTVRVPVVTGRSESVNVQTKGGSLSREIAASFSGSPGLVVLDGRRPASTRWRSTPSRCDQVLVGAFARPLARAYLDLWVVCDILPAKAPPPTPSQVLELLHERGSGRAAARP